MPAIFLGHAGSDTAKNFATVIGEVFAVRAAKVELEHSKNQEHMEVKGFVSATTAQPDLTDQPVSCGIPGHDRPGQEIVADHFKVEDESLKWEVNGRCGFAIGCFDQVSGFSVRLFQRICFSTAV